MSLGRRSLHIRHLNGWLVDFLRHHARIARLPLQHPRRRSLAHHQGCEPEAEDEGARCVDVHEHERDRKHMMVLPGVGVGEACVAGRVLVMISLLSLIGRRVGYVLHGFNSNSCIASTSQWHVVHPHEHMCSQSVSTCRNQVC